MSTAKTRTRIIETAELLFARKGYSATSLREITDAAGVNVAAVNYHFGSKENLLVELLDRIVGTINERRIILLDEMEAAGRPDVEGVLTAFLLPDLEVLAELRSRNPDLPRFVSRMYSEGSEHMNKLIGRQFAETQKRFHEALAAARPELSPEGISWRLYCIVGIVIYLFSGVETPGSPRFGQDVESDLTQLLEVAVPIMSAT